MAEPSLLGVLTVSLGQGLLIQQCLSFCACELLPQLI